MRSTVVFLASLLLFSAAVHTSELTSLAEIEAHPFGNTVMNLVQMNLKQQPTRIDEIRDLIKSIKDSLVDVQATENANFQSYTETNNKNIREQNGIVDKYSDQKSAEEKTLETNTNTVNSKRADKKSKENELDTLRGKIDAAKAENEAKLVEYSQKTADLNELIKACADAVSLLNTMQFNPTTISFIMVSFNTHMDKIKNGIKKIKKSNAAYGSMLNALTDLASNADPESVKNIITLINKLKAEFESELSSVIENEKKRKIDFADLIARYEQEDSKLSGEIETLRKEIESLDGEIARNNANIQIFQSNIETAQGIIKTLTETYAESKSEFDKNQAARKSEIDILSAIQAHFENKIVPEYNKLSQSAKDAINSSS